MGVLAALAAAFFLFRVRRMLPPFVMAAFISFVLEPLVSWLESKKLPRAKAILLIYAVAVLAFSAVTFYFVPRFARHLKVLSGEIPKLTVLVNDYTASIRQQAEQHNLPKGLGRGLVGLLETSETFLDSMGDNLVSYFTSSATFLSYVVVAPVIAYYILRDVNRWRQRALVRLAHYPLPFVELVQDVDKVIGGFVRGQSIVALAVGVMVWVVTVALGLKYGAVLGLLSGLGEFVPFFGPLLGAVPVLLAALAKSLATFFWALAFVVFIQWLDANLIVPRVTAARVGLHPLWVIFSLLAGAQLAGVWGVFLAVPAAGVMGAMVKFVCAMARQNS